MKRIAHSAVFVSSPSPKIYVIGGKTDNKVKTKLCEAYNLLTNQWEKLPNLNQSRSRAAVAYHEETNAVYAMLGSDGHQLNINTIEKLEMGAQAWQKIELLNYHVGFEISFSQAVSINKD